MSETTADVQDTASAPSGADAAVAESGAATNEAAKGQSDGAQEAAPAAEGAQSAAANVVPEKYEFTAPDGVQLDAKSLEEFQPIAKELKLDQTNAQKLVDLVVGMRQREAAEYQNQLQQWVESSRSDPEIGGAKHDEILAGAVSVIEKFGGPGLKELLDASGLGNHPELVRFAHRVRQAISDDAFVPGRASGPEKTQAQRLFPSMPH